MSQSSSSSNPDGLDSQKQEKNSIGERLTSIWARTGITWDVYKMMFKGALAPTICVALYQSDAFSIFFSNIAYLIAIITILSITFRPRATYLQSLLLNLVFVCATAAVVVLALFTIVKARENNPQQDGQDAATGGEAASGLLTSPYNSSASAVAGVWLFILVYILATLRSFGKQYMISAIMGSILANVSMVYSPQLANMTIGLAYIRTFLSAILTGMAIATGVSLLVFPTSNRTVIFEDTRKFISSIRHVLSANLDYIQSLEHVDMFTIDRTDTARHRPKARPEVQNIRSAMQVLSGIANKFQADLPFAKREIDIGYIGPDDLQELGKQLRLIFIPLVGLSCLSNMFERAAKNRGWANASIDDQGVIELKLKAIEEWHGLIKLIKTPFGEMSGMIDQALEHVLLRLRLISVERMVEPEKGVQDLIPGSDEFLERFTTKISSLHAQRTSMLVGWCRLHGVELTADYFTNPASENKKLQELMDTQSGSNEAKVMRRQLYLLLYMEFLLWSVGRRAEDFIIFVDKLKISGKLSRRRVIVPGVKRMRKWLRSTFRAEDNEQEDHTIEDARGMPFVKLGEAFQPKKDPMHLPAVNFWERFGNHVRSIATFFRSPQSAFGFRVACATMSIAVVAFLQQTQPFYTRQRLFWAQIMVAIGMQPTASEAMKTSLLRIIGTTTFMILAWVNWYIADGVPGAVIAIYFVFLHIGPWIIIKHPKYTTLGMIGPVTMSLIVGYELQVVKIGQLAAQVSGQEYYPVYELGPIRLATVLGGLTLAWIWTVFPFPVTEHQEQKQGLGRTLYLLAHYYSVMHETVQLRLRGLDTDPTLLHSVNSILEKTRRRIYMKCNTLLAGLRFRTAAMQYDIPFGGKFPRRQYAEITELLQSMLNFMVLVTYASVTFNDIRDAQEANSQHSEWLTAFRQLVAHTKDTSHNVATLLSLLASSVSNSEPLPPYLKVPEPFNLSEQLDKLDADILSVRHVAEPGYSSFAVTQLSLKFLHDDLEVLLPAVKDLVGELDFSFELPKQDKPA